MHLRTRVKKPDKRNKQKFDAQNKIKVTGTNRIILSLEHKLWTYIETGVDCTETFSGCIHKQNINKLI